MGLRPQTGDSLRAERIAVLCCEMTIVVGCSGWQQCGACGASVAVSIWARAPATAAEDIWRVFPSGSLRLCSSTMGSTLLSVTLVPSRRLSLAPKGFRPGRGWPIQVGSSSQRICMWCFVVCMSFVLLVASVSGPFLYATCCAHSALLCLHSFQFRRSQLHLRHLASPPYPRPQGPGAVSACNRGIRQPSQ